MSGVLWGHMQTERLTVELDMELKHRAKAVAALQGETLREWITRIVRERITSEDKKEF